MDKNLVETSGFYPRVYIDIETDHDSGSFVPRLLKILDLVGAVDPRLQVTASPYRESAAISEAEGEGQRGFLVEEAREREFKGGGRL